MVKDKRRCPLRSEVSTSSTGWLRSWRARCPSSPRVTGGNTRWCTIRLSEVLSMSPPVFTASHSVAFNRRSRPGQSRIRRSAVTSWCPVSAVATIMRSAGSPCRSRREPARRAAPPSTAISIKPSLSKPARHVSALTRSSSRPFARSMAISQKEIADTAAWLSAQALAMICRVCRPSCGSSSSNHIRACVSSRIMDSAHDADWSQPPMQCRSAPSCRPGP